MVLKLLQGPIVCTADPDDELTAGFDVLMREETVFWLDDHALVGYCEILGYGTRAGPGSTIVINLDGIFYVRSKTVGGVAPSGAGYDYITQSGIVSFGTGIQYTFEPWTGSYQPEQTVTDSGWTADNLIRLPDRFLQWGVAPGNNAQLASAALDEFQADMTIEHTFSPTPPTPGIHKRSLPGRDSLLYMYNNDSISTLMTYDWQRRVEVLPRRELGISCETLVYSPRFDIFISLHENTGNQEMRIWANELEVDALSAPIALTPITEGRVSTIQVTLTDDAGDGVSDRFIDWSITVGNGDLIGPTAPQSTTDENGVAEIKYRALLTGGVDPTIQASVTF
jgi:hypothetical protein